MPLMVEPLVDEAAATTSTATSRRSSPLVRQATELGADVIKADPTDDVADYHRVIEAAAGARCSCAAAAASATRRCSRARAG